MREVFIRPVPRQELKHTSTSPVRERVLCCLRSCTPSRKFSKYIDSPSNAREPHCRALQAETGEQTGEP